MLLRAIAFTALAAMTASAQAQTVNLNDSDDAALENALQSLIEERSKSGAVNTRAGADLIVRYLRAEGYYTARVITDQSEDAPIFQVTPGQQFHFTALEVEAGGSREAATIARDALPLWSGAAVRAEDVLAAETEGLRALRNSGWPDARLEDRTVTIDHADASARAVFVYDPGVESRFGDINLQSARWRQSFIERLSPFETGEAASAAQMRVFESRLESLESMSSAAVTLEEPTGLDGPQQRAVLVSTSPSPRHVAEAGFSLSTSEGGGVSGAYKRRNLFGGDETLDVNLNLATVQSGLQVELTAPHWRRLGQALTLEARTQREETDAYDLVEAGVGARVSRPITDTLTLSAGADLSVSHSENETLDLNVYTGSVSFGAVWDQRDSAIAPTQGALVSMEVSPTLLAGDASSTYFRAVAEGRRYQRLTSSLIIAGRLRAGGLIGAPLETLPPEQRFFAGGGGSARGYDYQSLSPRNADGDLIGGRSIVESSVELRWRKSRRWGGVVFVDSAGAGRDETPDFGAVRSAVGVGVRYYLDFAPLRLDIATPLDGDASDADIQIYLGLGEAF